MGLFEAAIKIHTRNTPQQRKPAYVRRLRCIALNRRNVIVHAKNIKSGVQDHDMMKPPDPKLFLMTP